MKQYVVLVLKPDSPSSETLEGRRDIQDKKIGDFWGGYVLKPKSKRDIEEKYSTSFSSRRTSGAINISLPYHGAAAGVNFEVRGIDNKELLFICNCEIKVDQVRLLEDGHSVAFSKTVQQLLQKKTDKRYEVEGCESCGIVHQMDKSLAENGCPHPIEVVYEWAKGTPFADICELTDIPEGLIVRIIVRLDETCREFRNAASVMGNSALFKKMETASNAIKRDIVFAAS